MAINSSKRQSLRFSVENYTLRYKTEFEDGEASVRNISAGGCALYNLTINVTLHEKVLLILQCGTSENIEIGGIVCRLVNSTEAAIKFLKYSESDKNKIVKFFAKVNRQQQRT